MKSRRIFFCLTLLSGMLVLQPSSLPARPAVAAAVDTVAYGMKNITVYARNAASALAKAQAKNPDWVVISVKKVAKDPKSMAYRVVLKKK